MFNKRFAQVSLASLLLLGVFWLSAGADTTTAPTRLLAPKKVDTTLVTAFTSPRKLHFSGTLRARDRADLAFTLSGRLINREVQIGDVIAKGDVVAQLDMKPLRHNRDAARATLQDVTARWQQATRDLERVTHLSAAKAATDEELEHTRAAEASLRASKEAAKTALQETERLLDEATLRAPFDAVVTEVYLQQGEFAAAGRPVVNLAGSQHLEMEFEVPESVLAQMRPGSAVTLRLPFSNDRQVLGTIRAATPSSGRPGRLFPVLVDITDAEGLVAGMTAELILSLDNQQQVSVPVASVINPGGSQPFVFLIRDDIAHKVPVTVGQLNGSMVNVAGTIADGDTVATAGFFGLMDGDRVEVQ